MIYTIHLPLPVAKASQSSFNAWSVAVLDLGELQVALQLDTREHQAR